MTDVIIVGGGAAGLLAALTAAQRGRKVTLLDKNDRPGRKLLITGKGRCNITNNCEPGEVMKNIPRNPKFLYSALNRFPPRDTMALFERLGVPLKTERGNRVFPASDKAADVVDALVRAVRDSSVRIERASARELILEDGHIAGVRCKGAEYRAARVLIATGGCSYPGTGSTGDGYAFAEQAGHTVTPIAPSLVPIVTQERWAADAMGLSLKNVTLRVTDNDTGKLVFEELGELLFTHFGVSGPLVLSASAHMRGMIPGRYTLSIDLKPALDEKKLDERLLRDIAAAPNKDFANLLNGLLPQKLIGVTVRLSGIPHDTKGNAITREQRARVCALLKNLTLAAKDFRPIEEAIITSGGVEVAEIDPKTMESKLIRGLFFAGEVLDTDAYTGGFNLQIAFSTGYCAGLAL